MLLALAVALAAAIQPAESITVNASALAGAWKINRPTYIAKRSLFGDIEFGPPAPGFCRVEQGQEDLAFHCLGHGDGRVSLQGRNIHFAWGSMLARVTMDGILQSDDSFSARLVFKLAGITAADSALSSGAKLDLFGSPRGESAQAQALRQAIAQDARLNGLGSIQAVALLGKQDKFAPPDKPNGKDYFTVYAVEFDKGERICGLHQDEGGGQNAYQCV
jgi:hypothetical protein